MHYPKENSNSSIIPFSNKVAVPYRKSEMCEIYCVPFWTNAKKSKTLRQFQDPLDRFKKKIINMTMIELYFSFLKLFKIWKSDKVWQLGHPNTNECFDKKSCLMVDLMGNLYPTCHSLNIYLLYIWTMWWLLMRVLVIWLILNNKV